MIRHELGREVKNNGPKWQNKHITESKNDQRNKYDKKRETSSSHRICSPYF